MSRATLYDTLESAESTVGLLRNENRGSVRYYNVPSQYTHWIEEQRAWRETCSLADQSHHMADLWVEGTDALGLFADVGINDFDSFEPNQAKQLVVCNPDGYVIGDGILFYIEDESFHLVGLAPVINWVEYHLETGDYRARSRRDNSSVVREGPPETFRYQIQGPNAVQVMEEVTDEPLRDIPFFNFSETSVDGRPIRLLRHGMSGQAGYEFWGPYEDEDRVLEAVLDVGRDYGLRRLGWKSYASGVAALGWVANPVPAVYDGDMVEYQRWLGADSFEAKFGIGGSFTSDDVSDYYLTPYELGYGRFVSFDHDFVGRAALQELEETNTRTKVTLVWEDEDVLEVFGSLFEDGDTYKTLNLPIFLWGSHHDTVTADGSTVGISKYPTYDYNERSMLSIAIVDEAWSEPGTEVSFTWGEEGESRNPAVERHVRTEIRATVAPCPYIEDRRKLD